MSIQKTYLNPCQRMSNQEQNDNVQARGMYSAYGTGCYFHLLVQGDARVQGICADEV